MDRIYRFILYWNGRLRLANDTCPRCNSSPPEVGCPICLGTYDYGPVLEKSVKALWRFRFDYWYRNHKYLDEATPW